MAFNKVLLQNTFQSSMPLLSVFPWLLILEKTVLTARRTLPVELLHDGLLDDVPALLCVGHDAGRAVFHSFRQGRIIAGALEEEEGAVAEEA